MSESLAPIHINSDADIASLVLLPGDPLRAKYIANNFLENAKEVTNVRNMLGFTGTYKGVKVSVMGSGMGMPSMGIYAYELFKFFDVKKIIRIGTCGVVSPVVSIPEIILTELAYTESNFAYMYSEVNKMIEFPSEKLNKIILDKSSTINQKVHVGGVMTLDVFGPYVNGKSLLDRMPKELNILGEEMESFALFHVANKFNREASCLLTAVDSEFSDEIVSVEKRETALNDMITLALESIIE